MYIFLNHELNLLSVFPSLNAGKPLAFCNDNVENKCYTDNRHFFCGLSSANEMVDEKYYITSFNLSLLRIRILCFNSCISSSLSTS